MTVGDPESGAEGREQSCVEFYGTYAQPLTAQRHRRLTMAVFPASVYPS